jgi:hypothetical protein
MSEPNENAKTAAQTDYDVVGRLYTTPRHNLFWVIGIAHGPGGDGVHESYFVLLSVAIGDFHVIPRDKFYETVQYDGKELPRYTEASESADWRKIRGNVSRATLEVSVREFVFLVNELRKTQNHVTELQKRNGEYHDQVCALKTQVQQLEAALRKAQGL